MLYMIVNVSYNESKNGYKVISWVVVLAYIKNEALILSNKFEIRKKDEMKVIVYLNRVIIGVNEYDNYNFK